MEAIPQMIITLISIAQFERRAELKGQDIYVLIVSAIFSYGQAVFKLFKNDEGSVKAKDDHGIVKYGRFILRAAEILATAILFVFW